MEWTLPTIAIAHSRYKSERGLKLSPVRPHNYSSFDLSQPGVQAASIMKDISCQRNSKRLHGNSKRGIFSQARAHRSDLAAAVHVGFAAEDSPHVLHLCEVVDCLAELESAHAIHLQAHLPQIALRRLAMCCKAPYPCIVQYVNVNGKE